MRLTKQTNTRASDIFVSFFTGELDRDDYSIFYCCAGDMGINYMKDLKYGITCTDINTYRRLRLINFIISKFFLPFTTDDKWQAVLEAFTSSETDLNKKMFDYLETNSCITIAQFKGLLAYAQKICGCCTQLPPHILLWGSESGEYLLWDTGDTNPIIYK